MTDSLMLVGVGTFYPKQRKTWDEGIEHSFQAIRFSVSVYQRTGSPSSCNTAREARGPSIRSGVVDSFALRGGQVVTH